MTGIAALAEENDRFGQAELLCLQLQVGLLRADADDVPAERIAALLHQKSRQQSQVEALLVRQAGDGENPGTAEIVAEIGGGLRHLPHEAGGRD